MYHLFLLAIGGVRNAWDLFEWLVSLHEVQEISVVHHQRKMFLIYEVEVSFHIAVADGKGDEQTWEISRLIAR
jgi:hypothetical protein